jgi:hypothetical protein
MHGSEIAMASSCMIKHSVSSIYNKALVASCVMIKPQLNMHDDKTLVFA